LPKNIPAVFSVAHRDKYSPYATQMKADPTPLSTEDISRVIVSGIYPIIPVCSSSGFNATQEAYIIERVSALRKNDPVVTTALIP